MKGNEQGGWRLGLCAILPKDHIVIIEAFGSNSYKSCQENALFERILYCQ